MNEKKIKPILAISKIFKFFLMIIIPLVTIIFSFYYYVNSGDIVVTDNAYVKADIIEISSEVTGKVTDVYVEDGQEVVIGSTLFIIDSSSYEIKKNKALAKMKIVLSKVKELKVDYRAAILQRDEAIEKILFDTRQVERLGILKEKGMIRADIFDEAEHKLKVSRMKLSNAKEKIKKVLESLEGDPNLNAKIHPKYLEAKSDYDEAQMGIEDSIIKSPGNGFITGMQLQSGEHVRRGNTMFSIVSSSPIWIEANFKETQLTNIEVGQEVDLEVDTFPGVNFNGKVNNISKATGAEFSILPPQNASGNWVKVVQRVPVKIKIFPNEFYNRLRVGMTVTVSVSTGKVRGLPPQFQFLKDYSFFKDFFSK